MIKELVNRGQEKVTPRRLFNEGSGGGGLEKSYKSPLVEGVGGYSSDESSISTSRSRSRSARKHPKSVSRKNGISNSYWLVRSEARSRSKTKRSSQSLSQGWPHERSQAQTQEAVEAAFFMKKFLSELPTLTTPKKGEALMMYLSTANEAVSAMLLMKKSESQMPIHYNDALSKIVVVQFDHLSKEVLVEMLNDRFVETQEVSMVVEEEGPTWMTQILDYLEKGMLSADPVDAITLMEKIRNYTLEDMVLYRKSYLVPLMRCVGPLQANYIIKEGLEYGQYGITNEFDTAYWVFLGVGTTFDIFQNIRILYPLYDVLSSSGYGVLIFIPSCSLGIDIVGPLSEGPGRVKYLIVAIDYFTKWMEAKPVATITKIGMPTHRTSKLNEKTIDQELRLNLDLLEERREITTIREARYKQQVKKYYNKKVRQVLFKVG
nr:hypothetical protein [Tanacetum cinerariifolium]